MKRAFFPRSDGAAGAVMATSAMLLAGALLAIVCSYWTWQLLAPRQAPFVPPQREPDLQIHAASALFGVAPVETGLASPTGMAVRLLGVVAAIEGRDAYAVVAMDGKQILAVRRGAEISPGVVLADVAPDHVVLDRAGTRETLAWPEKAPGGERSLPTQRR